MSTVLTQEERQQIVKRLNERNVKANCPMCGSKSFSLLDGIFHNNIQKDVQNASLGGAFIPTVAIFCTNCGFISQHALGALGMLNDFKSKV